MSEELLAVARELLAEMRSSFENQKWAEVQALHQRTLELPGDRADRLEAACLAVRAQVAQKQRRAAKELVRPLLQRDYKKPIHYDFLARALLDLKLYDEAANACKKADELLAMDASRQGRPAQ